VRAGSGRCGRARVRARAGAAGNGGPGRSARARGRSFGGSVANCGGSAGDPRGFLAEPRASSPLQRRGHDLAPYRGVKGWSRVRNVVRTPTDHAHFVRFPAPPPRLPGTVRPSPRRDPHPIRTLVVSGPISAGNPRPRRLLGRSASDPHLPAVSPRSGPLGGGHSLPGSPPKWPSSLPCHVASLRLPERRRGISHRPAPPGGVRRAQAERR
jgi:hypothetical protein